MEDRVGFTQDQLIGAILWRHLCNGPLHKCNFVANREVCWQ
jgi:hypothetical protein